MKITKGTTWDLEVEEDHSYNVEGVVVHNSVCTTRSITGVGYPQLSAILDLENDVHSVGGLICSDGGCTSPGDIAKSFSAGADFVMLGGMLSGTDQSEGEIITKHYLLPEINSSNGTQFIDIKEFKLFYGMSSETAMVKHRGMVEQYKTSEGRTILSPYKGDVKHVIEEILGGLRSTCTYVGASELSELYKNTTFIQVHTQLNKIFSEHTIGKSYFPIKKSYLSIT